MQKVEVMLKERDTILQRFTEQKRVLRERAGVDVSNGGYNHSQIQPKQQNSNFILILISYLSTIMLIRRINSHPHTCCILILLFAHEHFLSPLSIVLFCSFFPQVNKKLRVCDVCGSFLSILDSDKRLADHFLGKQHLGYQVKD